MSKRLKIPRVGEKGYARRGAFKVIARTSERVEIRWLDDDSVVILEPSDLRAVLVEEPLTPRPSETRKPPEKRRFSDGYECRKCKNIIYSAVVCPHCKEIRCPVCHQCGCPRGFNYGRGIARGLGH